MKLSSEMLFWETLFLGIFLFENMASFEAFHYRQFHQALISQFLKYYALQTCTWLCVSITKVSGGNSQIIGVRLKVGYDIYWIYKIGTYIWIIMMINE